MARSRSSAVTDEEPGTNPALMAAIVILGVATFVLLGYVLLLIVFSEIFSTLIESLRPSVAALSTQQTLWAAGLTLAASWGLGAGGTWAFTRADTRLGPVWGGLMGLIGVAAGAFVMRATGLI